MYKQNKHIGSQLADEWIDKNPAQKTYRNIGLVCFQEIIFLFAKFCVHPYITHNLFVNC